MFNIWLWGTSTTLTSTSSAQRSDPYRLRLLRQAQYIAVTLIDYAYFDKLSTRSDPFQLRLLRQAQYISTGSMHRIAMHRISRLTSAKAQHISTGSMHRISTGSMHRIAMHRIAVTLNDFAL